MTDRRRLLLLVVLAALLVAAFGLVVGGVVYVFLVEGVGAPHAVALRAGWLGFACGVVAGTVLVTIDRG